MRIARFIEVFNKYQWFLYGGQQMYYWVSKYRWRTMLQRLWPCGADMHWGQGPILEESAGCTGPGNVQVMNLNQSQIHWVFRKVKVSKIPL